MIKGLLTLFVIMKIMYSYRGINKQLTDAMGHFKRTQYIDIVEMTVNIVMSLILVYRFSITGVLLGTIIALFFSNSLYIHHNTKYVLKINYIYIIIEIIVYNGMGFFVANSIRKYIPGINSYGHLIMTAVPITIVTFGMFFVSARLINYVLGFLYRTKDAD